LNAKRSSVHLFSGPGLPVIGLAIVFLVTTALSEPAAPQPNNIEKSAVMRRTAQNWMQVGVELYARGLYQKAQGAFNRSRQYDFYLDPEDRQTLASFLEKTQRAPAERKQILQILENADQFINQKKYENAKTELEKLKGNRFLTTAEQKHLTEKIKMINSHWLLRKKQLTALYDRSVKFYRAGQLQRARDGFNQVAKSELPAPNIRKIAQDYLTKIDRFLSQAPPSLWSVQNQSPDKLTYPQKLVTEPVDKNLSLTAPAGESNVHLESLNSKRNILRSYAAALINDAIEKAQKHLTQGRFYKAKKAVDAAKEAVNENRLYLGSDAVNGYHRRIKALDGQIDAARSQWLGTWDQTKNLSE